MELGPAAVQLRGRSGSGKPCLPVSMSIWFRKVLLDDFSWSKALRMLMLVSSQQPQRERQIRVQIKVLDRLRTRILKQAEIVFVRLVTICPFLSRTVTGIVTTFTSTERLVAGAVRLGSGIRRRSLGKNSGSNEQTEERLRQRKECRPQANHSGRHSVRRKSRRTVEAHSATARVKILIHL